MRIGKVITSGILIFILMNFGIGGSSAHAELESSKIYRVLYQLLLGKSYWLLAMSRSTQSL